MSQKGTLHKIAILGTPRSGKTTFCVRLAKEVYAENIPTTRGIDFHVVSANLAGLKLQIWDLAGQGQFARVVQRQSSGRFKGHGPAKQDKADDGKETVKRDVPNTGCR